MKVEGFRHFSYEASPVYVVSRVHHAADSISELKSPARNGFCGQISDSIRTIFNGFKGLLTSAWTWIRDRLFCCCCKTAEVPDDADTCKTVIKLIDCMRNLDVDQKSYANLFEEVKKELSPKALLKIKSHLVQVLSKQPNRVPIDDSELNDKFNVADADLLQALENFKKEIEPQAKL